MRSIKTSKNLKVGIVGCGRVGMSAAFAMMLDGTPMEIALIDRDKDRVEGERLDLEQAQSLLDYVRIAASDDYADLEGSQLVVLTAGAAQEVGETRLQLCEKNMGILEEILPKILKASPEAPVLIISNPVDVLVNHAHKIVPNAGGRIFGSGTMLDTARFRYFIGQRINVNPKSVHAYILGEHGDSSFPVYENAMVGGRKLTDFEGIDTDFLKQAYEATRGSAGKIIKAKGATNWAIAVVISKIMEAMFSDAKTILPLSIPLMDYYGHSGVALSVPCVLGKNGIERVLKVELSDQEQKGLSRSVEILKEYNKSEVLR